MSGKDTQDKRDADKNAPRDGGSQRKSSGEKASDEAARRRQATADRAAKAEKAKAEGGVTPTAPPPENRQDVLVQVGQDVRVGADIKEPTKDEAERQEKAAANPTVVDHFSLAADASHTVLEINGDFFSFDVEQSLALRRLVNGSVVNLNF